MAGRTLMILWIQSVKKKKNLFFSLKDSIVLTEIGGPESSSFQCIITDSFVAYHLHCLGLCSIRNSLKSTMQTIEGENAPMVLDSCSSKSMSETYTAQRFHLGNYGNAGRHRSNQLLSNRIWEPLYQKKFMCSSLNLIVVPNFLCH